MVKFSVLMSVYNKETPTFLSEAIDSILNQTVVPNEIVLVKDGPLTSELDNIIEEYKNKMGNLFTIVSLSENVGLGAALAEGVKHCHYDIIARMDSDDISCKTRFENQIVEFQNDPDLDICGSYILEFEGSVENIVARRTVPTDDVNIKKHQKRRDAFNHVSVMMKKETVIKAGNYKTSLLMEDTLLWVNMIIAGAKCKNLPLDLVYVRIGDNMYQRRGGLSYYRMYKSGRKKVRETGYISIVDYYYTLAIQLVVALLPNRVRGFIFKRILHGKV